MNTTNTTNAPQPAADPLAHIPPAVRAAMQAAREEFAALMRRDVKTDGARRHANEPKTR